LLPDTCIVKVPDRDYWCDDVQAMTKRNLRVYALDRRRHYHLCELCPSYELYFIEHQYEASDEVDQDEDKRNELYESSSMVGGTKNPSSTNTDAISTRCLGVVAGADLAGCLGRPWRRIPCAWPTFRKPGTEIMEEIYESRCNSDL